VRNPLGGDVGTVRLGVRHEAASVDRLTADDVVMLWTDEHWPLDIGVVAVLEGEPLRDPQGALRIDDVRAVVTAHLPAVPRFRQRLVTPRRGLGRPFWTDDHAFDIDDHVRVASVAEPGGEAELVDTVESIRRRRLDRSRPLWEMWLLPGLAHGRVGLFVRAHHAIGGGVAGIAMLAALLDPTPDAPLPIMQPWTPQPAPSGRALVVDNLRRWAGSVGRALSALAHPVIAVRRLRRVWLAGRDSFADLEAMHTSLERRIGDRRTLMLIRSRLDDVKLVAHRHDAKVNDVLLTVVAGGLRTLLENRGERVEDLTVPAFVPATLHDHRGRDQTNLLQWILIPLPVGEPDPVRRLQLIAEATARRRDRSGPPWGRLLANRLVRWLFIRWSAGSRRAAVYTTNVPGPPTPLYLAGARLLDAFPIVPLIETGPGIGALSYARQFNITIVADPETCPDVETLGSALDTDLRQLVTASANPTSGYTAP
jgi:diacylglycerol O-acyltransferase / wax synthase